MVSELTKEEISAALDETTMKLLEELHVTGPPVDAIRVAAELGIVVAVDRQQQARARIARFKPSSGSGVSGSIILRPDARPERLQWAVAHEIGEAFAGQVLDRLGVRPLEVDLATREQIANCVASRLLLPRDWFERDAQQDQWDLLLLKTIYSTASHELIARRMLDFPPAIIITIIDNGEISSRLSNAPGHVPPMSTAEHHALQRVADQAVSYRVNDRLYSIQAWPIHEPHWRREILRTEWCDDYSSAMDPSSE